MPAQTHQPTYEASYALVIGINDYQELPPLKSAVRDADAIAQILQTDLGFDVTLLRNAEASRDAILEHVNGPLTRTKPDDRVLIYFAGHGATRQTARGDQVGLLVPHGAGQGEYHRLIEMDYLIDLSKYLPAKHILFVLDACFSGLAVTRSAPSAGRLLEDLMTRRAVQAIAAGQQDQLVSDLWGPGQHSIFTGLFLERLRQRGGLLTGNEMGLFLQRQVGLHTRSRQTPHYGHLLGSEGGDFVFWAEERVIRLPAELIAAIENPLPGVREGATRELEYLAKGSQPELAALARNTLVQLTRDDSRRVSAAAQAVLDRVFPEDAETLPDRLHTRGSLPVLVFVEGPLSGQRIPVMTTATIGRMTGSTVVLDDPRVSGYHTEIEHRNDGTLWITDLNSTNGTFVNDERIGGPRQLELNDTVQIGNTRLILEQAEPADIFSQSEIDVTLGRPTAPPEAAAAPTPESPAISSPPVTAPEEGRFRRFVRRWWQAGTGLLALLSFGAAWLATSGFVPVNSRAGALFMIPAALLLVLVTGWHLARREWPRAALHLITSGGWIALGIWTWTAYGIDSVAWWVSLLALPVIPTTIWLVLDALKAD